MPRWTRHLASMLVVAGLTPALSLAGNGNIISVDSLQDGSSPTACTLRDAIRSANEDAAFGGCAPGLPGQDEIRFDVDGIIMLTDGALAITEDLIITGPGIDQLNIDAQAASQILEISGDGFDGNANDIVIRDLTLSNAGPNLFGGGAIFLERVDHTLIERVEIRDGLRGGIQAEFFGNITLIDSAIRNITRRGISANIGDDRLELVNVILEGNGQGLWCSCELYISHSEVINNNGVGVGNAGGIETDLSDVFVADSIISGNSSDNVGGLLLAGHSLEVRRVTISDNQGGLAGGGMLLRTLQTGLVEGVTIKNNSVVSSGGVNLGRGGGLFINTRPLGQLQVVNTTISGNLAETGGGVYFDLNASGQTEFNFVTIADNQATDEAESLGGGISFRVNNAGFAVSNTIVAGNSAADGQGDDLVAWTRDGPGDPIIVGAEINLDFSLVEDSDGFDPTGTGNILDDDPLFDPLADNGGPTLTHGLRSGSPALNAADPDFEPPPMFDQRGPGFDRVLGGRPDMGAVENDLDRLFSDRFELLMPQF